MISWSTRSTPCSAASSFIKSGSTPASSRMCGVLARGATRCAMRCGSAMGNSSGCDSMNWRACSSALVMCSGCAAIVMTFPTQKSRNSKSRPVSGLFRRFLSLNFPPMWPLFRDCSSKTETWMGSVSGNKEMSIFLSESSSSPLTMAASKRRTSPENVISRTRSAFGGFGRTILQFWSESSGRPIPLCGGGRSFLCLSGLSETSMLPSHWSKPM
mmetsp:Transcript_74246/g.168209  ORF Transcript_74246/g.168209 Transcript_74246/m.168209 type:complete len:214 (-) Transcript_74246:1235-1876(-)